jgi:hypothetical protein
MIDRPRFFFLGITELSPTPGLGEDPVGFFFSPVSLNNFLGFTKPSRQSLNADYSCLYGILTRDPPDLNYSGLGKGLRLAQIIFAVRNSQFGVVAFLILARRKVSWVSVNFCRINFLASGLDALPW